MGRALWDSGIARWIERQLSFQHVGVILPLNKEPIVNQVLYNYPSSERNMF